jgi:cobalamin biosynthesis protein CobT
MIPFIPNIEAEKKFAKAYCNKMDITVKIEKNIKKPQAGYNADWKAYVWLRTPNLMNALRWRMESHHEIKHLRPDIRFTYIMLHLKPFKNVEKTVANILVDNICERVDHGSYSGQDRDLWLGRKQLMEDQPNMIVDRGHIGVSALFEYDIEDRRVWQGTLPAVTIPVGTEPYLQRFQEIEIFERIEELLDMYSEDWDLLISNRVQNEKAQIFLQLCEEVSEAILEPVDEEDDDDSSTGSDPDMGSGSPGMGDDGDPDPDSDGDDDSDSDSGKSVGSSGKPADEDEDEEDEEDSGVGGGEPDDEEPEDEEDEGGGSGTPDDDEDEPEDEGGSEEDDADDSEEPVETQGAAGDPLSDDIPEIDLPSFVDPLVESLPGIEHLEDDWEERYYGRSTYHECHPNPNNKEPYLADEIQDTLGNSTVSKQVKKFLKITSKETHRYGLRRGKIHGKNLSRILTQDNNPRIFKKKDQPILNTNSAICLLVDCSASMSGRKYITSSACAVAISQTLQDLRIVHEVLGFKDGYSGPTHIFFKSYEENITRDKLIDRMASSDVDLDNNADGESVLFAAERLMQRKEANKMLMVQSDGNPVGYFKGDGHWYLKQVCETIEKSGQIDLIGIGILTDCVRKFYTNHEVVNDITELDDVLFAALKRNLTS